MQKMEGIQRVLILSPHTDDGEFGCGGTIAKLVNDGKDVFYVAFSSAAKSVPEGFPRDILKKEVAKATGVLGIPREHLILLDYEVRDFPEHRQEILEDMVRFGAEIQPDLVLLPSPNDTHQDHQAIAREGFRAFKRTSMIGYEIPWNNLTFNTNVFVLLSEVELDKKIDALKCYESQQDRAYAQEDFIRSLAKTRGIQIGGGYAEVFEAVRWVIR